MANKAGVWIDHKKAVVILISDQGEETKRLKSNVPRPARSGGGPRVKGSYTRNDFVAEDKLERKATGHLNEFYDAVIASLGEPEAILILGPGEAKGELKKRIKNKKLRGFVAELETDDKMTDRQIAAKVREHFLSGPARG
ncbi:MAG TPA: hypothetical protein VND64_00615 [Pirellulales bacterium]|nr:hypothetical protein [Pirellulales bacterium]